MRIYRIQILAILLGLSTLSFSQISSVGKDWGGLTSYSSGLVAQDSIYVFFSSAIAPKMGSIKAKFSDGSISNFQWFKYDASKPLASRFVAYAVPENGVAESNLTNLARGGYKVTATRVSDSEKQDYYCWVMIDDVVITSLEIDNRCDFLEVIAKTLPSALSLRNLDFFRYWDFKSSTTKHSEINTLGIDYFKNIKWQSSNPQVALPSFFSLILTIGNSAPLYESKYDIQITNPFGRDIKDTTELLPAKAAKADFTLFVDKDANGIWTEGKSGEAPLAIKFDTESINADSVYWQILNDALLLKKGGDSIIWSEGYKTSEGIGIIPDVKLMPGKFPLEHIAYNITSGCRDTMTVLVEVDTSFIIKDAIPNVFTPNGDGLHELFKIKDDKIDNNYESIKTFKISIFSRQGMLVYSYSGNPKEWEGWGGKIDGSKRDAPEGIYYFIIDATGWDDRTFKRGPYKGFLYLFRGQ
ncbi:MAG: gliding motility-associated C-terminal domain-containing protein [Bacteroidales bacterium]|nr:MAG: gliding motility-associated C-terminal domain-containing protein [Bacteroidales bacterium]